MKTNRILIANAILALVANRADAQVRLSEVYAKHAGSPQMQEYIELEGPQCMLLTGVVVAVVRGDGVNAGMLENAWDLTSLMIPATPGFFVLGDSGLTAGTPHFILGTQDTLPDVTQTIYLISSPTPSMITSQVGQHVEITPGPGMGTTSLSTFGAILDVVALVDANFPGSDTVFDGAQFFGPDAGFIPAGLARCADTSGWSTIFLQPNPGSSGGTPFVANANCLPGIVYCLGDGTGAACPCANSGALGNGCANSINPNGANLTATGSPSVANDTIVLAGSGMLNSAVLYFQGTTQIAGGLGAAFGDGLRCVGGSVIRLVVKTNVGGASIFPGAGDPSVSVKGAISPGDVRNYQCWYRNAGAFCTPSTFNLTNGLQLTWQP